MLHRGKLLEELEVQSGVQESYILKRENQKKGKNKNTVLNEVP